MRRPTSRLSLMVGASPLILLVVALLVVWGGRAVLGSSSRPRTLRLATGSVGSNAVEAGDELGRIVETALPGVKVELVTTQGGDDNLERLLAGDVDLAIVHNTGAVWSDAEVPVRIIGPLYDEAFHVVVRDGVPAQDWHALAGLRVNIGPPGSGTNRLATSLLPSSKLAVTTTTLPHQEAARALVDGELDAFFVLAGVRSPAVEAALDSGQARLLSLGMPGAAGSSLDGLRIAMPSLQQVVIPARAYGQQPVQPVGTVGVRALWAARDTLPEAVAWALAKNLHEHRRAAAETFPLFARISGDPDEGMLRYALHPGAARYYHRDDPPFILAWADTVSLLITVALLLYSGLTAGLRWRASQRKYRVDRYYAELQAMSSRLEAVKSHGELRQIRRELYALRRRAVDDLMRGRLEPDESFTIFQDYVRSEIQEIDALSRDPVVASAD